MRFPRRLEVTLAGRWFLALTIALGVVGLISGKNGLYLIESLLLAGLILSGVLSERSISGLHLDFSRGKAIAGELSDDWILVRNIRRFPIFCVEIGEWRESRFHRIAYIEHLAPGASIRIRCGQILPARGHHTWSGFAFATSFPFGFARKIKVIPHEGSRVVWPARPPRSERSVALSHQSNGQRFGSDIAEGEIRPFTLDDDPRMIVWTLSARGLGPMVRVRRSERPEPESRIDLRQASGEEFEREVSRAAKPFFDTENIEASGTLLLISSQGVRRFQGHRRCLDQLALCSAEGKAA